MPMFGIWREGGCCIFIKYNMHIATQISPFLSGNSHSSHASPSTRSIHITHVCMCVTSSALGYIIKSEASQNKWIELKKKKKERITHMSMAHEKKTHHDERERISKYGKHPIHLSIFRTFRDSNVNLYINFYYFVVCYATWLAALVGLGWLGLVWNIVLLNYRYIRWPW